MASSYIYIFFFFKLSKDFLNTLFREGKSQQSSSQTGGELTYSNNHPDLLGHENDGKTIRQILNNRMDKFGRSVTGTVIKNGSDPLVTFQILNSGSYSETKRNLSITASLRKQLAFLAGKPFITAMKKSANMPMC